jgi:hypothetical protein
LQTCAGQLTMVLRLLRGDPMQHASQLPRFFASALQP